MALVMWLEGVARRWNRECETSEKEWEMELGNRHFTRDCGMCTHDSVEQLPVCTLIHNSRFTLHGSSFTIV